LVPFGLFLRRGLGERARLILEILLFFFSFLVHLSLVLEPSGSYKGFYVSMYYSLGLDWVLYGLVHLIS